MIPSLHFNSTWPNKLNGSQKRKAQSKLKYLWKGRKGNPFENSGFFIKGQQKSKLIYFQSPFSQNSLSDTFLN
jgi:hypothetical protein